jgi:hypothetical protein
MGLGIGLGVVFKVCSGWLFVVFRRASAVFCTCSLYPTPSAQDGEWMVIADVPVLLKTITALAPAKSTPPSYAPPAQATGW